MAQDGPKLAAMLIDSSESTGIACEWPSYLAFKVAMKEYASNVGFSGVMKPQGVWANSKERKLKLKTEGGAPLAKEPSVSPAPSLCRSDGLSESTQSSDYIPHGGKYKCKIGGCPFALHFRVDDRMHVTLLSTSTFEHNHLLGPTVELSTSGTWISHEDNLTVEERAFVVTNAQHPFPVDVQTLKRNMQGSFPNRIFDRRLLWRLIRQEQTRKFGDDASAMMPFLRFGAEKVKSTGGIFEFDVDLYNRLTDVVWQYPVMRRYLEV